MIDVIYSCCCMKIDGIYSCCCMNFGSTSLARPLLGDEEKDTSLIECAVWCGRVRYRGDIIVWVMESLKNPLIADIGRMSSKMWT